MKVKEVMTRDVISLSAETSAREALDLLLKMQISGLPVIDDKKKLLGMFTEKEVLSAILPSYMDKVGRFAYQDNPKAVKRKVTALRDLKVKDIMRKEAVTVDEDTALCEVAHIMLVQEARRLPVLTKNKEVVGIVSRGDIVKNIFQEYSV